ncbi:MAG: hypothetical protein JXK08_01625 [Flavobacteriaceae bacterium]|nr:hypothetical protein [Flavobacteriaceae bacterium]
MKYITLLAILILCTCVQNTKTKSKEAISKEGAIEVTAESIEAAATPSDTDKATESYFTTLDFKDFNHLITTITTKELPIIETASFDSFIEPEDYKIIDINTLKLPEIYAYYLKEGDTLEAINAYRVNLSDQFYSLVITYKKNDYTMITLLVNYGLDEQVIDHQIIAYDDIINGDFKKESKIIQNHLIVNEIFLRDINQVEEVHYNITYNGYIEKESTKILNIVIKNYKIVDAVLQALDLNLLQIKTDLIYAKTLPYDVNQTVVVIPEIKDESEAYFQLNSHILIYNNHKQIITHQYFESYTTNQWVSDALQLKSIDIDTAPYMVTDTQRAFGVKVYYEGASRINPYDTQKLSLFIQKEDRLKKILHNFQTLTYAGEWDGECTGKFTRKDKVLVMSSNISNGFYNINVNNTITEILQFVDETNNCDYKETTISQSKVLTYNGNNYVESED